MYQGMRIQMETRLESVSIPYNDAISVALVTNELISNCIQHAFPSPSSSAPEPKIVIELRNDFLEVVLSVMDNGAGIGPQIDPKTAQSVGMSIIRSIVSELRGSVRYSPAVPRGTEAQVRFQRQLYPPIADI